MSRKLEKTGSVPEHIWRPLMDLFGTLTNAQEKLRLTLPQTELREALRGFACRPDTEEMIRSRWLAWCHQNLRGYTLGIPRPNNFRVLLTSDPKEDEVWAAYLEAEDTNLQNRVRVMSGKKSAALPPRLLDFPQRDTVGRERQDYAEATKED